MLLKGGRLLQASVLPRPVRDVSADSTAQGFAQSAADHPTYAWLLHRQSLLVWKVDDGTAAVVRRLNLPQRIEGRVFVQVLPQCNSTALTVVVCTGSGGLFVWLDATFAGEPFSQQLFTSNAEHESHDVICALEATPAEATAGPGFLAVVATSDAALHLYHGSHSGIFPRQFYNPRKSTGTHGGVLDMIGAAVGTARKVAVDLQLLAGLPFMRTSASTTPALQLQLLPLGGGCWKMYVLTHDTLDCWLVGTLSGKQSTEQLQWSYGVYQAVLGKQRAAQSRVLGFAASNSQHWQQLLLAAPSEGISSSTAAGDAQQVLYVWSAHMPESALRYQHTLTVLVIEEGTCRGPRVALSLPLDSAGALPQLQSSVHGWQVCPHAHQPSCLLMSPGGQLLEWSPAASASGAAVLSTSSSNLAVCCSGSGSGSNWKVFNGAYGVLEFLPETALVAAVQQPRGMVNNCCCVAHGW